MSNSEPKHLNDGFNNKPDTKKRDYSLSNTSPWITWSKKTLDRIRESHSRFMETNKKVRFEDLAYNLDDLFSKPPIFEIPPLRFSELED